MLIARIPDPLGRALSDAQLLSAASRWLIRYCDLRTTQTSCHRWLMHAINAPPSSGRSRTQLIRHHSQTHLTRKPVRECSDANRPCPEQKRIADKLDSTLARVEACRDRLDRLPALLKRFRQSILAAATSGRLTEDWRATRSLDEAQRAPESQAWSSKTVGELINDIEAGLNVKCDERPPETGERGLVKISAVTWGVFDEQESKTLPSDAAITPKTRIRTGDFLISRANTLELVGACVLVHEVNRELHLSDKVLRLAMPDDMKPWLLYVLRSAEGRRQIEARASGNQLSMRNLSQANLREISVPMPSKAEIAEIVRRVETLFAFADRLEARLATARKQAEQLTPALLAKAFRGELVPQDPNDEPATELLKRLATTRTEAPKAKRGRKVAP
ncbi:MAG: hypothetical protein IPN40_09620 [Uliginosibacterium sp.]|nr:hypothetical protein [Uliginosibacterium sp.]